MPTQTQGSDTVELRTPQLTSLMGPFPILSPLAQWNIGSEDSHFSLIWWTLKFLVFMLTNGGPLDLKRTLRKCFKFLTSSFSDIVLVMEQVGAFPCADQLV